MRKIKGCEKAEKRKKEAGDCQLWREKWRERRRGKRRRKEGRKGEVDKGEKTMKIGRGAEGGEGGGEEMRGE